MDFPPSRATCFNEEVPNLENYRNFGSCLKSNLGQKHWIKQ